MRAIAAAVALGLAGLLAVFLGPPAGERPAIAATPVDFEIDVLPGVQTLSRLSDGWHVLGTPRDGWQDWLALDFVANVGRTTVGMPVDAVFRHVHGPAIAAKLRPFRGLNNPPPCDGFVGAAAVLFMTTPDATHPGSGWIRLALHDGAELAREAPAESPGLTAVFDALTPPPAVPGS